MEKWLSLLYNIVLLSLLAISGNIYIPFVSMQMVVIAVTALTGNILVLPLYILLGLVLPVFMQGGGPDYFGEPSFLLMVIFTMVSLIVRPMTKIKSRKPWIWQPTLLFIYLIFSYGIFFLISYTSHILFKNNITLNMNWYHLLEINLTTLVIASFMIIFIINMKETLDSILAESKRS